MTDPFASIVEQAAAVRDLLDEALAGATAATAGGSGPDDRLRVLLLGLERAKNAADGVQALIMTELGREALAADALERAATERPTRSHEEFVPDEIAVLLSCTRVAASNRYGTAWQIDRHPPVAAAWRAGAIDVRKAATIADQLQYLPAEAAESLAVEAAERAKHSTVPQTREWLRRRVLAIDPEVAERRRQAAIGERKVVVTPDADGMSDLWARLPSLEARRMQLTLSKLAQGLGSDDPRTMDQRRADVLVDLVLGRTTPVGVDVQLVIPADAASGRSEAPAWVPGVGPITADAARELLNPADTDAQLSVDAMLIVDTTTGTLSERVEPRYRPSLPLDKAVRSRDMTCRFPGCRRSALGRSSGTDLDHTVPWPVGTTSGDNLAVLCRHHHRLKHSAGWQVTLLDDGTMTWSTPSGRSVTTEPWQYADPSPDQGIDDRDHDPPDG
jgi:hypothetical protein